MTVYCGVDFHARKQTISYLTIEDGEVQQTELHHEQDDIRGFYAKLRNLGPVIVGFETSGYAAWFEEMLEELGCEIWIGIGPGSGNPQPCATDLHATAAAVDGDCVVT